MWINSQVDLLLLELRLVAEVPWVLGSPRAALVGVSFDDTVIRCDPNRSIVVLDCLLSTKKLQISWLPNQLVFPIVTSYSTR